MASDIYAKPDFSKKVRYNRKQLEDTSDWEDCEVEIYHDAYESLEDTTGVQSPEQAPQTETCPKVQKRFCRGEQWRLLVLCTVLSAGIIILSSFTWVNNNNLQMEVKEQKNHSEDMVVNINNLQREVKELKIHFEDLLLSLENRLKTRNNHLQTELSDMAVNINNLQREVKELKIHFEDPLVSLENNRLKTRNNHLQTELSGINKTLLDEIKQLKNQIEVFKGNRCPEGWKRIGCNCYYKSTEEKDWHDSRDFCKDEGSDLVVVNSKEEQEFVSALNQKAESWIGLFAEESSDNYEWKWVDGSPLTETFWDEKSSKDAKSNNAVFLSADGKWKQQNRGNNKNWI
ncbi:asialoglycoprotein receptor 1 isoform X2 [Oryzias latipes]|nr:asialoglycoprotein receptor 1 isoform X2 [Oryzias latipes]XP_023815501.1 asialoglycoprotein receptor 1 isoform X2 [Oryzias latipes]